MARRNPRPSVSRWGILGLSILTLFCACQRRDTQAFNCEGPWADTTIHGRNFSGPVGSQIFEERENLIIVLGDSSRILSYGIWMTEAAIDSMWSKYNLDTSSHPMDRSMRFSGLRRVGRSTERLVMFRSLGKSVVFPGGIGCDVWLFQSPVDAHSACLDRIYQEFIASNL